MRQVERYRPIDAQNVPPETRLAGEDMLRCLRRDLQLDQLTLKWFSASDRQLTQEELLGPDGVTLLNLNGGVTCSILGKVSEDVPTLVWCRADLTPHMAARVVAHEARHAWQILQEQAGAVPRRLDSGEKDARAYTRSRIPTARELVRQRLEEKQIGA